MDWLAGLVLICAFMIFLTLLLWGPNAEDYARVCKNHDGVASVTTALPAKPLAVCRDGTIFTVKG